MRDRIEKILQGKKLTQAEFADYIGVNRSSITHLMTGRNKSSDTVVARALLAFPDISPQWLSEGVGEMYQPFIGKQNNVMDITMDETEDEEENPLIHFNNYEVENQPKTINSFQEKQMPESSIPPLPQTESMKDISQNTVTTKIENTTLPVSACGKQIRKIVFFYSDKTFEEYYPETTE
jgi:transcriptional regulator with XRE-family HTH domain